MSIIQLKHTRSRDSEEGREAASAGRRRGLALAGAGAVLGGSAAFNLLRTRQAEREHPPQGKIIEIDGVRLHHLERGQGRALVLLHGMGLSLDDFLASGLIDEAAKNYRVIAFDRPGFGHSSRPRTTIWTPEAQAELIAKALRLMGVGRAIVLGHSLGTMVAVAMALDHPDLVSALVLLSGYYFPIPRADMALMAPPAIPIVGDVMRYTLSPPIARLILPAFIKRQFAPAEVTESFQRYPRELIVRPSQLYAIGADAALVLPAAQRLSSRLDELELPTIIVAGEEDWMVMTASHSVPLHEKLSGSTLHLLPGVGHMIHHLAPDRVVAAIDEAAKRSQTIEPEPDMVKADADAG